jgi:hypothetical protein
LWFKVSRKFQIYKNNQEILFVALVAACLENKVCLAAVFFVATFFIFSWKIIFFVVASGHETIHSHDSMPRRPVELVALQSKTKVLFVFTFN